MSDAAGAGNEARKEHPGRRVPALFVSHGVPASLFDLEYGNALRRFSARQVTLDGIVVVSAHWESLRPVRVTRSEQPTLLQDFSGMPTPVQRFSYQLRGHIGLADRVIGLLGAAGIAAIGDAGRGLDHGAWVPISIAYPSARGIWKRYSADATITVSPAETDSGYPRTVYIPPAVCCTCGISLWSNPYCPLRESHISCARVPSCRLKLGSFSSGSRKNE
jgi:hypothetical protein